MHCLATLYLETLYWPCAKFVFILKNLKHRCRFIFNISFIITITSLLRVLHCGGSSQGWWHDPLQRDTAFTIWQYIHRSSRSMSSVVPVIPYLYLHEIPQHLPRSYAMWSTYTILSEENTVSKFELGKSCNMAKQSELTFRIHISNRMHPSFCVKSLVGYEIWLTVTHNPAKCSNSKGVRAAFKIIEKDKVLKTRTSRLETSRLEPSFRPHRYRQHQILWSNETTTASDFQAFFWTSGSQLMPHESHSRD